MASLSLTSSAIASFVARSDAITQELLESVALFGDVVSREVDAFATVDDHTRAARALVFAILSPQAKFDQNVRAIDPVLAYLYAGGREWKDVQDILKRVGYAMRSRQKCEFVVGAADFIVSACRATMTRENILKLRGYGMKASAMAMALYDATAPVMTLDTWMLNGLMGVRTTADKNETTLSAADACYRAVEQMLLAACETHNVKPFVAQWAMWNLYRGGKHESHVRIFGL
jgi:hypothetical protein